MWSEFNKNHKYSLSKTLRFELKTFKETKHFFVLNNIFETDFKIQKSYEQAKYYFDSLHRKFIVETFLDENVKSLDFECLAIKLNNFRETIKTLKNQSAKNKEQLDDRRKKIKNIENKISALRKEYYKKIKDLFDQKAKKWKKEYQKKGIKFSKTYLKQKGTNFFLKAEVLKILKKEFPKQKSKQLEKEGKPSLFIEDNISNSNKKDYIFDTFDHFSTYLIKFFESRKNLYKDDGTSTAVATRIISNFEIFLNNQFIFNTKYKDLGKINLSKNLERIFQINFYYSCLIQSGIDEYNDIIGKINKKSKEYRDKNKITKKDAPLFKTLEKQILSEKVKKEELIVRTSAETEEQVFIKRFKEFINENDRRIKKAKQLFAMLASGKFMTEYDGIYLKKRAVNTIAYKWFADPNKFLSYLSFQENSDKKTSDVKQFTSLLDIKNIFEDKNFMSQDIFKDIYYKVDGNKDSKSGKQSERGGILDRKNKETYWQQFLKIWKYEFDSLFKDRIARDGSRVFWGYTDKLKKNANSLSIYNAEEKEKKLIKNYCDSVLRIYQMMSYFSLENNYKKDSPIDFSSEFYFYFDLYYKDFEFNLYYNAFRNFITKKPSDKSKIKLNFKSGSFLTGFDKNKEREKLGVILRKNNNYFLGVINKNNNNIFSDDKLKKYRVDKNYYEKMEYKLFPNCTRMVPKIAFAKSNIKTFGLTAEIEKIKTEYNEKKDISGDKLSKLIDYYKNCLEKSGKKETFNFQWKKSIDYKTLKEFYDDLEKRSYKVFFVKVAESYIDQMVKNGSLYLFRISNKDFVWAKGKKNLHTLYFLNIFSKENLADPILKLSGNAEVFYRKASFKKEKEVRGKKKIDKYKRYTEDKILFHLPIEMNYGRGSIGSNSFNENLNLFLSKNKNKINVIGIDRGEKNLIYYCVINKSGEILDYGSLNEINGVNYFEKLALREAQRIIFRQSWEPVIQIKDLKKGYLSYVIKKISDLAIKYNAIVVLEDLNFRFKQIRTGIRERAVYQQFEKALIDKLGYLVFKETPVKEPGGVLNAYQLTAPFVSFDKMGKQSGAILYTTAEYTSKTDPLTGFRKNIFVSNSASASEIITMIGNFKEIGWSETDSSYYFIYNQKDFATNKKNALDKEWKLYSKVPRIKRRRAEQHRWEYDFVDLNEEFREMFRRWNFSNLESKDLRSEILKRKKELRIKKNINGTEKNFYQVFIYLFNLMLEVRSQKSFYFDVDKYKIDYGIDFFASPVKPFFRTSSSQYTALIDKQGKIISKRIVKNAKNKFLETNFADFATKFKKQSKNIFDSDGVGAYNIARKGLMMLQRIFQNPKNPKLTIDRESWDRFVSKNF